jgi:DNA polymerase V
MAKLFALVDCNNFYVSCERLFRPELRGRPVVVLSNNDGCVIARSNEAKALGIAMGTPYFKVKELVDRQGVEVFSSNYALYGDLSLRVMTIIQEMEGQVEVYSIDEAFISLPATGAFDAVTQAARLKERIGRCVGISVSIGIGPTKTLAKIANRVAKKEACHHGVFLLPSGDQGDEVLAAIAVGDVWGIGHRSSEKLARHGITTAWQLKNSDLKWARRQLTVTGARTVLELGGTSCIALDQAPAAAKSILSSRSFKKPVTDRRELNEAMATYTALAAAKLRHRRSCAGAVQVFIATNRFDTRGPAHADSRMLTLPAATSHTPTLIAVALKGLAALHREGCAYQKAGVMLTDLRPAGQRQLDLFAAAAPGPAPLMTALDAINARWGRNTLQYAAEGLQKPWAMRQDFKSPAYTGTWQELPLVHCR